MLSNSWRSSRCGREDHSAQLIAKLKGRMEPEDGEALFAACKSGDLQRVRTLLSPKNIVWKNRLGWTPLHVAVEMERVDVIDALIAAGAPLEERNAQGWTPLGL